MVAAASIGVSVKTLFIVLYCVMAAAFVYLFMFGDLISCFDIHSRWFILIVADFTAYVVVIGGSGWSLVIEFYHSQAPIKFRHVINHFFITHNLF
ncbi:hypothetical protein HanPI659440_Chr15g0603951 [Helianthus annuus]|nr:hypothetical protein HanPI659440_Chr15g0603951 [Helianthus annuus]